MNCKVIFTDTAEADLRDIAFYIANQSKKETRYEFIRLRKTS